MKKILAILMALSMVFSLAACGEKDNDDDKKDKKDKTSLSLETDENNNDETAEFIELSRGVINGNTYTNAFIGVSFTKPSDWTFASEEELASTFSLAEDLFDMDIEEALENNVLFYDAMAKAPTGENVMFGFESLEATNSVGITVEEYLSNVKTGLLSSGLNYSFDLINKTELSGKTFDSLVAYAETNGVEIYQKYYVAIEGEVVVFIAVTVNNESNFAEIEAMFDKNGGSSPVNPTPSVEVTAPPAEEDKLSRGVVSGNVYTNDYADITFSKPYNWNFASETELAETLNSGMDLMNVTDMEAALADEACIYDMMAESEDGTANVLVMFGPGEDGVDEAAYAEVLTEELKSYEDQGIYYEIGEVTVKSFAGKIYHVLPLILNGAVYQNMYIRMVGDIVVVVTLTSAGQDDLAELEAMFS